MSVKLFEKGSISFRVGKNVVSIVLLRYLEVPKVIRSVRLDRIEEQSEEILELLADYRRGQEKWHELLNSKLPIIRRKREAAARELSYEQISRSMDDIVWSLKRHCAHDRHGTRGGQQLAVSIWKSWQEIRPIIASASYWSVSEEMAKKELGLKAGKKL